MQYHHIDCQDLKFIIGDEMYFFYDNVIEIYFTSVSLEISQQKSRWKWRIKQAISHCQNHRWSGLLTHIKVTLPRLSKYDLGPDVCVPTQKHSPWLFSTLLYAISMKLHAPSGKSVEALLTAYTVSFQMTPQLLLPWDTLPKRFSIWILYLLKALALWHFEIH